ncbi:MAG TPA: hypothetical protein VEG84_01410, partial [Thermoanaerobaculia bacterium]|nr:hypothetical protein [Thermoanaerobaculia bacterium]
PLREAAYCWSSSLEKPSAMKFLLRCPRGPRFYYLSRNAMGRFLAVALFFLPGALFVRRQEWERAEPIEIFGIAMACSAAFWAVSFWALRWLAIPLTTFAGSVVGISVCAFALRRWKRPPHAVAGRTMFRHVSFGPFVFLALVFLLRFIFPFTRLAYSGGDMTAHATMAEEIVFTDGFPRTQEPLQPFSRFGEISPGFHVISALVSLFGSIPTYRSTIWVLCIAIGTATFTLYALLRGLSISKGAAAACAAGALFLARNPQFFLQWGGAPSVLAAAIAFLLLRDLLLVSGREGFGFLLRAALLAAGVVVTHVLPAISLAWLAAPILAVRALSQRENAFPVIRNVGAVLALAVLLALPFLWQAPKSVSPAAAAWAHDWIRAETQSAVLLQDRWALFRGREATAASWPFYVVTYLGAFPALALLFGLSLGWRRRSPAFWVSVICLALNAFLFAAALGEFLPGWPALYPTRIGLWLAIPLSAAFAEIALALEALSASLSIAVACLFAILFGVEGWRLSATRFGTAFYETAKKGAGSILAVPLHEAVGGAFWITTFSRDNSAVTADDLAAFDWIRANTPQAAVFANNPGDGGPLIPAAAHRKILEPHYYWFFDQPEMEAWRARTAVDYVYVGAEPAPPWGRKWTAEQLDRDPRVALAARLGRARVYRVLEPYRISLR